MESWRINNDICPATSIGMITSIASHGQGVLETGPVSRCYGGAEEDTASKAWVYSKRKPPRRSLPSISLVSSHTYGRLSQRANTDSTRPPASAVHRSAHAARALSPPPARAIRAWGCSEHTIRREGKGAVSRLYTNIQVAGNTVRVILGVGLLREYTLEGGRFAGERERACTCASAHVCVRQRARSAACACVLVLMWGSEGRLEHTSAGGRFAAAPCGALTISEC
jgi:hypothetical protein